MGQKQKYKPIKANIFKSRDSNICKLIKTKTRLDTEVEERTEATRSLAPNSVYNELAKTFHYLMDKLTAQFS